MKRRPSSRLWKQIFGIGSLWVVAQRRKQRVVSKLLEKLNAEFYTEREREREREREGGFEHFSRFLVYGVFILLS